MKRQKFLENGLYFFLLSLGISIASLLLCAFIMALICYSGKDPARSAGVFSLVALVLSAMTSGVVTTRIKGDGGAKFAGLSSLALMLLLFFVALIIEKGSVHPSAFMNYGCFVGVAILSAIIGRKREKRRRHR